MEEKEYDIPEEVVEPDEPESSEELPEQEEPTILEESLEPIDQEPDFTLETTHVRSSLRFRAPFVLIAVLVFFVLRRFDPNSIFNPVNSTIFIWIASGTFLYGLYVVFLLQNVDPASFRKESVYRHLKRTNDVLDFLSVIPYLMVLLSIVNAGFVSFSPISGTSMEPNFSDDEAVVFSHLQSSYDRFDVVIVYVEELDDPYLIKRVIGLPGETIVIDDNEIYVNGVLIAQDFIDQTKVTTYCIGSNNPNYCMFVIPDDSYFVLGDNRDGKALDEQQSGYSIDSRSFGPVQVENLYGKVVFKFKDFNILN